MTELKSPIPSTLFQQDAERPRCLPDPPENPWKGSPLGRASLAMHAVAAVGLVCRPRSWRIFAAALALDHLALCAAGLWPRGRWLGPNVERLSPQSLDRPWVALTLDDGPDPEATPQVLDLLQRYGARASFFCVGSRAASSPNLVRRIVQEGHRVENHTHNHPNHFSLLGRRGQEREIIDAQQVLFDLTGRKPRWFRAPAGIQNPLLGKLLHDLGLPLVSWTRRGFDAYERDPRKVIHRLTQGLQGGDILLLHDGFGPRHATGRPVVLDSLKGLLRILELRGLAARPLPDPPLDHSGPRPTASQGA